MLPMCLCNISNSYWCKTIITSIMRSLLLLLLFCVKNHLNCASLGSTKRTGIEEEIVEVRQSWLNGRLRFDLHAFGEDLRLIVFSRGHLAIPQAQVIRRHNGYTVSHDNLGEYYTGYLHSQPGSSLAIKFNNGSLSGVIITDRHVLTIHATDQRRGLHRMLHVIARQRHENETLQRDGSLLLSNISSSARVKRSSSTNRYVELMIVADRYTTESYGDFTEQYLMSTAYLLNAVMQSDSIGPIKVFYTIVNMMIISGNEKGLDLAKNGVEDSVDYLRLFATWTQQFNVPDDSDPKHFDQAILITKKVCGLKSTGCYENGRGYFADMCSETRSVASAIAAGLSAALTAAHETGHNFGLSHDSGDCANGYIMHAALAAGKNAFSWSSCSRTQLQAWFMDSSKFSCLNDKPSGVNAVQTASVVKLARNYSANEQCRLMYGNDFGHCAAVKSNCKILYCHKSGTNFCIHRSTPPLEGTECGTYKWCQDGECVDQPIPDPIDGQWSAWSQSFSDCTRTCGMGVRYRTRTCDSPAPEYFGKDCEGESKGDYETCNTQDCAAGTDNSRLEQCKKRNAAFSEYLDVGSPCLLRCKQGNIVNYFSTTVNDGTLCSPYKDERDVCVLGKCKKVSCDRTFRRKFYDRCRICSGDGSACRFVSASYDTDHRQRGPKKAAVMAMLPIGSANILVQENSATYNNIGLKDQSDAWIIDERTGSSVQYAAGSRVTFERAASKSAGKLMINGPITEPLKLMFIHWFEVNTGISYEYYEPLSTPDATPLTFTWKFTLTDCSETCAGGIKTKVTTCHRTDDDSEVGLEYCDSATQPNDIEACNTQACDPSWQADSWSTCSATCGDTGMRTRTIECRQKESANVTTVLSGDQCNGTKPDASEICNRKDCKPEWVPAEWSACSMNKCQGVQTRTMSCKKLLASGELQSVDDSECPSDKPLTELICNDGVICYEWRPVYPSCAECQDYFRDNEESKYKKVGCYKIKDRLFGPLLRKLTLSSNKEETVAHCARVAWERARRVFAVGPAGECYSSMNAQRVYYKEGKANDCIDDVIGGAKSVYVYAITGKVLLSTPTCYSVENDAIVADSNCIVARPAPEIKVCCEEICQDNCLRTRSGSYCSIPYVYRGNTYYGCTKNDHGRMWCSTTSNFDVDGLGGECEEPCRQRTTSGVCCSFPFVYRGRLYNACTQGWCALTSNYDRDGLRGTCV